MPSTISISLSHQIALKDEMDVVAHNIANANTTGYKGERMMFSEYLATDATGQTVSYVEVAGLFRDNTQGRLDPTHNPLDLAIRGKGYFVVDTPDGERYARSGHFQLDAERNLVTVDGFKVLDEGGGPITLAPGDIEVQVAEDGTVRAESGELGRLKMVDFAQPGSLIEARGGLYSSAALPVALGTPQVAQGMLEASNVEPILQVTRMIGILRAYQSAQNLSSTDNDLIRKTINEILSIPS